MASLFDLDGLVGGHRANAFESRVQHRPPAYVVLSVMAILQQIAAAARTRVLPSAETRNAPQC